MDQGFWGCGLQNLQQRVQHCQKETPLQVWKCQIFDNTFISCIWISCFPAYQTCLPSILLNRKFVSGIVAASFATVAATTKCNFPAPRSQCVSVTTATPCWSTSNLKCSRFCQAALDHSRLLVRSTYFQHNCPAFQSLCSLFYILDDPQNLLDRLHFEQDYQDLSWLVNVNV